MATDVLASYVWPQMYWQVVNSHSWFGKLLMVTVVLASC